MTINTRASALTCLKDTELPIGYSFTSGFHADEGKRWAFFTHKEYDDMHASPFVYNPVVLKYDNELTTEGEEFLNGHS
jgi:hypothetical protein